MDKEQFIKKYGEQYRRLIIDALDWLDRRELVWKLTEPMDREKFIENLVHSADEGGKFHDSTRR